METLQILKGYTVVSNLVETEQAENTRQAFLDADYDLIKQVRRGHFQRMFPNESATLPSHNEIYTAEFYRSSYLEKTDLIREVFRNSILPKVQEFSNYELNKYDLRAYKMSHNCHFRIHLDDYTAEVGFIWYLSKEWKWDWGGLLLAIDQNKQAKVFIPEWNQLIILDHASKQVPHCVTTVGPFTREPLMMLVGFLS